MEIAFDFEKMSFDEFFELYKSVDEITKDKLINDYCKAQKIGKSVLKKEIKHRLEQEKEKNKQEKIKKIFGTDTIVLPKGYDITYFNDKMYLTFSDDKSFYYLAKMFIIVEKIIGEHAFLKVKFAENNKIELVSTTDFLDTKKVGKIFADRGEVLDNKKIQLIVRFVGEFLRENENEIKIKYGAEATGWNENIGDFCLPTLNKKIEWIDEDLVKRFNKSGSLEKQFELIKQIADKKIFSVLLFSMSAPFIKLLSVKMNYVYHIGGVTGSGKSLACKLGVSVWGEPDVKTYGANWNATLNGLESYLEKMKDVPSWIDEMELAKDWNLIVQLIYMYAEGRNRSRAYTNKDGKILAREPKTFRGVLFTSAEKNIDEIIDGVKGRNKPLGINRRVLSYESDYLWSDSGDEIKKFVGNVIDENWGNLGAWWIEKIKEVGVDKIKEFFNSNKEEFGLEKMDGKENIFYLMLVVLDILAYLNVITAEQWETQRGLLLLKFERDIKEHNKLKDIAGNFIDDLIDFLNTKKANFIESAGDFEELKGEFYGVYERKVGRAWLVKNIFDRFCRENGYVKRQVLDELFKKGLLICDKNRKDKRFISDWGFGRPAMYCIALPLN